MKKIVASALLIIFCIALSAQTLKWVNKQGGNSPDQTNGIATDTSGNIIVVGTFDGTATLGTKNITTNGNLDIFIAKYDTSGNCLWAKNAGGSFGDEGRSVAVDLAGNIYITGVYGQSGAMFDAISVGTTGGLRNGFLAKYSPGGNALWVKRIGGTSSAPDPRKIAVTGNKVYVGGEFYGTVTFDGLNTIISTPTGGSSDVFLAQFDTVGTSIWANRGGDKKDEKLTGLTVDPSGNPIIYGSYDSLTTFTSTTKIAQTSGFDFRDMYVVKYSPSGGFNWVASFGGYTNDESGEVCADASGNIYTTGLFRTDFISGTVTASNSGTANTLFLHKISGNGTPLWVNFSPYPNSIGFQKGVAMAISGTTILVSGYFGNKYKAGNDNLTGSGENNPLLIRYDTSGTQQWGVFGNGTVFKVSQSLAVAIHNNNYYYAGYIAGGVTFGTTTITAPGTYTDGFICAVREQPVAPTIGVPTALSVTGATTTSVQLSWAGTSSEFRVVKKLISTPTSTTDGDLVYEGPNTSINITGLTANTPYFIAVYGKASGSNSYSATARKIAATTVSTNPDSNVVLGFIAGQTGSSTFGGTRVKINITSASASDGQINVELVTNLVAGTLPVNIDSLFTNTFWRVTNSGLGGGSLRYCITLDATHVWGLIGFLNYNILKRPQTGAAWEDLMANSSYTVSFNSPEITVCGLSTFSEFAIGTDNVATGIKKSSNTNGYSVFPNPGKNSIIVQSSNQPIGPIEIYSIQGQLIRTVIPQDIHQANIERNGLPAGLYLIKSSGLTERIMFTD